MGWRPVDGFDCDPVTRGVEIDDIRNRERHRRERAAHLALKRNTVQPRDATIRRRKLSAVVIVVGFEVLMDRGVRVMRAGVVPMCLRERSGKGQTRHEREADNRRAQLPEHESDYGRRRPVRQTPSAGLARPAHAASCDGVRTDIL
jgi:hypothetical protein